MKTPPKAHIVISRASHHRARVAASMAAMTIAAWVEQAIDAHIGGPRPSFQVSVGQPVRGATAGQKRWDDGGAEQWAMPASAKRMKRS